MTTEQIQTAILDAIARRDELVTEARAKFKEAGQAEYAFKQAYARAMLQNADGKNAEERKARAEIAVDAEMFKYKITEAEANGVKLAVFAKADEISAYQSLLRLDRAEMDALHFGQHDS